MIRHQEQRGKQEFLCALGTLAINLGSDFLMFNMTLLVVLAVETRCKNQIR